LKKNILFITWDGPQTSYMEGLFMPIFHQIQLKDSSIQFHCLQFTWGENQESQKEASKKYSIPYTNAAISRKPLASIGSFHTLFTGSQVIKKYVKENKINILMPRSNFPAFMVNKAKLDLPIIFDADGLPIEERIEFVNLKRNSILYNFFFGIEKKMLQKADVVITRSKGAINHHLKIHPELSPQKFRVVFNGRDKNFFYFNNNERNKIRNKYNLKNELLFVYCGSLDGEKYLFSEMLALFKTYNLKNKNAKFLILSGSTNFKAKIPAELKNQIIFETVPFEKVPSYLSAADVALGLIKQSYSMQAVSALKLGEYLLMGLPVVFSKSIGDSTAILKEVEEHFLYDSNSPDRQKKAVEFIGSLNNVEHEKIRNVGLKHFSLEKSAESYLKAIGLINADKFF